MPDPEHGIIGRGQTVLMAILLVGILTLTWSVGAWLAPANDDAAIETYASEAGIDLTETNPHLDPQLQATN